MGKAAVDLPDPLQSPPDVGKPLTSTDDLLSQLAGDEIDRLLAEVEVQQPEPGRVAGVAESKPAGQGAGAIALPAEPVADAPQAPGVVFPVEPAPASAPSATDPAEAITEDAPDASALADRPDVTAELDAFFKSAVETPAERLTGGDTGGGDGRHGDLRETSHAERFGLQEPVAAPPAANSSATTSPDSSTANNPADADAPLPAYLRPLEWINAPLVSCPATLRDIIGKAAIITLVNAAAVIAYVVLFRK